jgi:hypothetical protein
MKRKIINYLIASLMVSFSSLLLATGTATGPNNVFMEQLGNTNVITIEQVGGTNNIGGISGTITTDANTNVVTNVPDAPSASNYATINGGSNTLSMTQHGNNNWAQYIIRGSNNRYSNTVTGNDNNNRLVIGDTNHTDNHHVVITETITGNSNSVIQNIIGNYISSTLGITGNSNQVTENLLSTNGVSDISITGNSNLLNVEQSDVAGAIGHNLKEVIVGNFNAITTQQQGTNDTTIDIKTSGDNNTITVRSSSSTIVNAQAAIAR